MAWSALGHATPVYEAALSYATQRTRFGKPLAKFQLVQVRPACMLSELASMQLHCVHLAGLDAAGQLRPTQASMAKFHNTRKTREPASLACDMLGGDRSYTYRVFAAEAQRLAKVIKARIRPDDRAAFLCPKCAGAPDHALRRSTTTKPCWRS